MCRWRGLCWLFSSSITVTLTPTLKLTLAFNSSPTVNGNHPFLDSNLTQTYTRPEDWRPVYCFDYGRCRFVRWSINWRNFRGPPPMFSRIFTLQMWWRCSGNPRHILVRMIQKLNLHHVISWSLTFLSMSSINVRMYETMFSYSHLCVCVCVSMVQDSMHVWLSEWFIKRESMPIKTDK